MSQPFAFFDIDGTLIRWQLYHAVFDELAGSSWTDKTTYQQIKIARSNWQQRSHSESYKEYELRIVRAFGKLLKTLSIERYEKAINSVFDKHKDQVYTYTRDLIKELKAQNYLLFTISGSPEEIIGHIAKYYGFDDFVSAKFERQDGRFTGKEQSTIFSKGKILKDLVKKHSASYVGSIGVGDGYSDRLALELVEQPIAFNPERKLYDLARQKGWQIVIERKNVIYKFGQQEGKYVLD